LTKVFRGNLELEKQGFPLDIQIGKGAIIGKGVKINYNLDLGRNVKLCGMFTLVKMSAWR
jgi:hypothetical protein